MPLRGIADFWRWASHIMSRHLPSIALVFIGGGLIVVGDRYPLWGPVLVPLGILGLVLGGCLTSKGRGIVVLLLRRRFILLGFMLPLVLAAYIGTFWYWWQRSPVEHFTAKNGRKIQVVMFQYNRISWHTQVLWIPAFAFMKSVCGYEEGGFAAMYEESVMEYLKYEDGK